MGTKALRLADTTIGKKAAMAVTGVVLLGFVLAHMLGNLQVFMGPEVMNNYARMLHSMPGALWTARFILLAAVVVHAIAAFSLIRQNRAARPIGYRRHQDLATTYAAKTMPLSGIVLIAFIGYHLAHLTVGAAHNDFQMVDSLTPDAYGNVVRAFQIPWVSGIYVIGQLALGLHLYHGAWSFLQTLGVNHRRFNHWRRRFAVGFAVVVTLGFISVPVGVLAGLVTL